MTATPFTGEHVSPIFRMMNKLHGIDATNLSI